MSWTLCLVVKICSSAARLPRVHMLSCTWSKKQMKFGTRLGQLKAFVQVHSQSPRVRSKCATERALAMWAGNQIARATDPARIRQIKRTLRKPKLPSGVRQIFWKRNLPCGWQARIYVSKKDWYGPARKTFRAAKSDYVSLKNASRANFASFHKAWKALRS